MKQLTHGVCLSALLLVTNTVQAGSDGPVLFDSNAWYRMSTLWKGKCESLDVINDGTNNKLQLAQIENVSGQLWKIKHIDDDYYRMTTMWQGTGKSLEVVKDGIYNNQIRLGSTKDSYKQYWKIVPERIYDTYRITNKWRGPDMSLDIVNDGINNNQPVMASTGNYSGQYWYFTQADFVTTPPAELNLDPFYKKYLNADGIPVVSSDLVPDAALYRVQFLAMNMLTKIPHVRDEMVRNGAKIAVMADTEVTTDIPEHAFLANDPNTDWDTRARGLGGTLAVPTASCAEENLLCYTRDKYSREDIFVHEFAHSIHKLGLSQVFSNFDSELQAAYDNAVATGLWENTYAITNPTEYFAEGVQAWFNVNAEAIPTNGIHNHVNTREELEAYDPSLYYLIWQWFTWDEGNCSCH